MDLIFLHGGAASGKLTTARELASRVGYPVFHNHLVVDLLTTVFTFGSEPFVRLREQMWMSVFADAARAGTSLIFTFAPESTVPPGFPGRVRKTVDDAGGRVCFVRLLVSEAEQERICAARRRTGWGPRLIVTEDSGTKVEKKAQHLTEHNYEQVDKCDANSFWLLKPT